MLVLKTCASLFTDTLFVFRDEPYHGAGDYGVPYGGVPAAHHSTWPHPDVQQMQASQQDARQQRYNMIEVVTKHLSDCVKN